MHDTKGKGKAVVEDPSIEESYELDTGENPSTEKGVELDARSEGVDEGYQQMPNESMKTREEGGDVSRNSEDETEDDFFVMAPCVPAMHAATDKAEASQQTVASGSGETLKNDNIEDEQEVGDNSPLEGFLRKAQLKRKVGLEEVPEGIASAACGLDKVESSKGERKATRSRACKKLC